MKEGDLLLPKVPQVIIPRKLQRRAGFAEDDTYLNNAGIFTKQFYEPAMKILLP